MAASNFRKSNKWREISPDRNVVWSEPQNLQHKRVPVLYYLSKNGHLQHPHFLEVPLSSPRGLFLKDVINRLIALRGKAMPYLYSWSCKRSYKNGYVWHDLSENDLIYPAHGHDYILKGSELPANAFLNAASPPASPPPEKQTAASDRHRRNLSCSSVDFDNNAYKPDQSSSKSAAADVSTQTADNRSRRRTQPSDMSEEESDKEPYRVEIEVSTPPSDSSPETLGTLMKASGQARAPAETAAASSSHRHQSIQRFRSSVLMQLISCGSMPFKDCRAGGGQGLIGHNKIRAPRGGGSVDGGRVELEEKEYFSGSLVETKKREFPAFKRSNSYNAGR